MRKSLLLVLMLGVLVSGCAGLKSMSRTESVTVPPEILSRKAATVTNEDVTILSPSEEALKTSKPYRVYFFEMTDIQLIAESYAIRYNVFLQDHEKNLSKTAIPGCIVPKDGTLKLMVVDLDYAIVPKKRAYVGSRSKGGRSHQYSLNGKYVSGLGLKKFDWNDFPSPEESGIEIWDIVPGSDKDKVIIGYAADLAKQVENLDLPNKVDAVLDVMGKVTYNDFFVAYGLPGAVFSVGIRAFAIIELIFGEEDMNSIHLETKLIDGFSLGMAFHNYDKQISKRLPSIEDAKAAALRNEARNKAYEAAMEEWVDLKNKFKKTLK